jgi:hypothetical protein
MNIYRLDAETTKDEQTIFWISKHRKCKQSAKHASTYSLNAVLKNKK